MTKIMKAYASVWVICFALFSAIVFLTPIEHSDGFWIGYVFTTIAFLGQFGCTYKAFKTESLKKCFYNDKWVLVNHKPVV